MNHPGPHRLKMGKGVIGQRMGDPAADDEQGLIGIGQQLCGGIEGLGGHIAEGGLDVLGHRLGEAVEQMRLRRLGGPVGTALGRARDLGLQFLEQRLVKLWKALEPQLLDHPRDGRCRDPGLCRDDGDRGQPGGRVILEQRIGELAFGLREVGVMLADQFPDGGGGLAHGGPFPCIALRRSLADACQSNNLLRVL